MDFIRRHLIEFHKGDDAMKRESGKSAKPCIESPAGVGGPCSSMACSIFKKADAPLDVRLGLAGTGKRPGRKGKAKSGRAPRVLVVDDDPKSLRAAAEYLSLLDISVRAVSSGQKALQKVKTGHPPDLVLVGSMVSGMKGGEFCRDLRERYSLFELPVLILTSRIRLKDHIREFESGVNDYIHKPLKKRELITRVLLQLKLK